MVYSQLLTAAKETCLPEIRSSLSCVFLGAGLERCYQVACFQQDTATVSSAATEFCSSQLQNYNVLRLEG